MAASLSYGSHFRKLLIILFLVAFLFSSVISTLVASRSYAVTCDTDFYSSNDIMFYNPCEGSDSTCSTAGLGSGTISQVHGANNGEKIFNFWLDAGFSREQSAGVTGSMKHEGGFSPFRQEMSQSWPDGGWGIAQFTWDPGQRGDAKAYVSNAIGSDLFNQYYKNDYGGSVMESNGFIPAGVPTDVNDKFLLAELNYLLIHIKQLVPNDTRTGAYQSDFGKNIDSSANLFEHIKTLATPTDAAVAWTYLYEWPGDIKNTAQARGQSAEEIFSLYTGGASAGGCGGPSEGGMTLDQAKEFMATYKKIDEGDPNGDYQYTLNTAGRGLGCNTKTDNCVAFSTYFVRKYTDLNIGIDDGGKMVGALSAANPGIETGTTPKPYAIFGTRKGVTICDDGLPCGHTGVVLGVDTARQVVIVGEAAYCNDGFLAAREYPLSEWSNGEYTYIYTTSKLKSERKGELK